MNCINCHNETTNPKFCSRSCSVSYSNKQKPKRKHSRPKCLFCDKIVKSKQCKFCCQQCNANYREQQSFNELDNQEILLPKGHFHGSKLVKNYISYKAGNCCSICRIEPVWNNNKLVLILDHINGIPDDWSVNNLRLVCPNCDSQLPTYKSKNHGSGRPYRKGKST